METTNDSMRRMLEASLQRPLSRREMLALTASAGAAAVIAACGGSTSGPTKTSSAFSASSDASGSLGFLGPSLWNDTGLYSDYLKEFPNGFEYQSATGTTDVLAKLKTGVAADTTDVSLDRIEAFQSADLLQPWDTSLLKNWSAVPPEIQKLGSYYQSKQYGLPLDYFTISVIYRTDKVDPGKNPSWSLLWDDRYAGKITWTTAYQPLHFYSLANKIDTAGGMSDSDLASAKAFYISKKKLIRNFYATAADVTQALTQGDVWIAHIDINTYYGMAKQGVPVGFLNPSEGRLFGLDGLLLTKGATHPYRAHRYADARLGAAAMKYMETKMFLPGSNFKVDRASYDKELVKYLDIGNLDVVKNAKFRPLTAERTAAYTRAWTEVRAA